MLEKYSKLESILVVGHNPNLSEFLGRIMSEAGCEGSVDLKKGAVARVEMGRNAGTLNWLITPRILRGLYTAVTESSRPKTSRK
jgi:phosphohistidine phosphatase